MYSKTLCKNPSLLCGPSNYPVSRDSYRVEKGNLRKLGWTYSHGTVFAPRQYRYQKEATAIDTPEMYTPTLCKIPSYLCGPSTTPSKGTWYGAENANMRKLGWTYRHGTVFAPRQYLYQKEDKGMKRPEMYLASRCKTPLTCASHQTIPSQGRWYRVENGNLRKLG